MTGLEIGLAIAAIAVSAAGTGVAIHQSEVAKQEAENAAQREQKRAKLTAQIRAQDARNKLRQQLAAQDTAASSGPVGILGASQEVLGIQTTRNILGSLRRQNLQTAQGAQDRTAALRLEAFNARTQSVTTGLQGSSQILGQSSSVAGRINANKQAKTTGF